MYNEVNSNLLNGLFEQSARLAALEILRTIALGGAKRKTF
jgi:hypothetical protein